MTCRRTHTCSYLTRRTSELHDSIAEYNARQRQSTLHQAVPRDVSLKGGRLAFRKLCHHVHEGATSCGLQWPQRMTLDQFLPLADHAFRVGTGKTEPPELPPQQDGGANGHGDASGTPGRGSLATAASSGSFRVAQVQAAALASSPASTARSARSGGGGSGAGGGEVVRGGKWHRDMCYPAKARERDGWLREVWDDLPRSSSMDRVLGVDAVSFLQRNAAPGAARSASQRTFFLFCR